MARNDSALVVSALSTALPKANLGTLKNPIPNPVRVQEMQRLSAVLDIPAAQLDAEATLCDYFDYGAAAPTKNKGCWTGSPLQPIPLVTIDNTTPAGTQKATEVALRVLEQQELYPGVTAQIEEVRDYPAPDNASAAQLIGHVGKISQADIDSAKNATDAANMKTAASIGGVVGQEGLEAEYNSYLRRQLGHRDVLGHAGRQSGLDVEPGAGSPWRHCRDEHRRASAADRRAGDRRRGHFGSNHAAVHLGQEPDAEGGRRGSCRASIRAPVT